MTRIPGNQPGPWLERMVELTLSLSPPGTAPSGSGKATWAFPRVSAPRRQVGAGRNGP